jgi:hypothetical protein
LHARFHADDVLDRLLEALVDFNQVVNRANLVPPKLGNQCLQLRAGRQSLQIGDQFLGHHRVIGKRVLFRGSLDKEIERVDRRHLDEQIDLDDQFAGWLVEDKAGVVVAVRVLLPVEEVVFRVDAQRIAQNRRPAVRRRPQPDDVRLQGYQPVVAVRGLVVEGHADCHESLTLLYIEPGRRRFAASSLGELGE